MSSDDPFGFSNQPGTESLGQAPARDPRGPSAADSAVARTPVGMLLAAIVIGLAAVVIAVLFGERPPMAVLAWVLAGPVGIGLYAAFRMQDTRARSRPFYAVTSLGRTAPWAAFVVLAAGVVLAALRIAQWIGHL